jgi:hypothetical protein
MLPLPSPSALPLTRTSPERSAKETKVIRRYVEKRLSRLPVGEEKEDGVDLGFRFDRTDAMVRLPKGGMV